MTQDRIPTARPAKRKLLAKAALLIVGSVIAGEAALHLSANETPSQPRPRDAVASSEAAPEVIQAPQAPATPPLSSTSRCDGAQASYELIARESGVEVWAAGDLPGTLRLRVHAPAGAQVYIDTDEDRQTGMWTQGSPVSSSGWDLLVEGGRLLAHAGAPTAWSWAPAAGLRRAGTDLCVPVRTASVRVAVASGDSWAPHAFGPGARFPRVDEPIAAPGDAAGLVFAYGSAPWMVGDCDSSACAARVLGEAAHVVFGAGLESGSHPGHRTTSALIGRLPAGTRSWGYVSLVGGEIRDGRRSTVYSVSDIARAARAWREMGVDGVFLDEADLCRPGLGQACHQGPGGPIEVTRAHQAAAIAAIHDLGLAVFANAWSPWDLVTTVDGIPGPLRPGDVYLIENPSLAGGVPRTGLDALASAAKLRAAARIRAAGIQVAVVDTWSRVPDAEALSSASVAAARNAAVAAGVDAWGLSDLSFGANGRSVPLVGAGDITGGSGSVGSLPVAPPSGP